MFSRIRGFLDRHKRKFVVSGLLIGTFIFITRYTQRKLREWQEKEIRELLERTRKSQHFESTERTCDQTITTLANSVRNAVTKALDSEAIVNKLRNGCTDKVTCWNNLKTLAIARSAVIIYSYTMLVAILRIQLNLIGGYMFKDTKTPNEPIKADGIIQQEYLSLCEYFMDKGVEKLSTVIKQKVEEITASISLRDELTLRDLEQIYWSIMSLLSADLNADPVKNLPKYMIPEDCERETNGILLKMINETLDLLESEEVQNLVQANIKSGFVLVIDHVSEYFGDLCAVKNDIKEGEICTPLPDTLNEKKSISIASTIDSRETCCYKNNFLNLNEITMPVAKIIPIINGQVPDLSHSGDLPSDWLYRLILNHKLKALGANIYEAFSY